MVAEVAVVSLPDPSKKLTRSAPKGAHQRGVGCGSNSLGNYLEIQGGSAFCGQRFRRKLAPLSGLDIQWATSGVSRGEETGELLNAKIGCFADALWAKL